MKDKFSWILYQTMKMEIRLEKVMKLESRIAKVALEGKEILGSWVNQHGSLLNIYLTDGDKLTGTFRSGVGAHDRDEEFNATGMVSDRMITFSVNFEKHGCLTSWMGHYTNIDGDESIDSMWHLARIIPEGNEKNILWSGIWTGADRFIRRKENDSKPEEEFEPPRRLPSHPLKLAVSG